MLYYNNNINNQVRYKEYYYVTVIILKERKWGWGFGLGTDKMCKMHLQKVIENK